MLANAAFLTASGLFSAAVSAFPALLGGDLSPTLMALSFGMGVFVGLLTLRHHGSAAAAWRYWSSPPR